MTNDDTGKLHVSTTSIHSLQLSLLAVEILDYASGNFTETFQSGSTDNATECVNISIMNDSALEGDQDFTLILSTSDTNVHIARNTTIITIIDDDGE